MHIFRNILILAAASVLSSCKDSAAPAPAENTIVAKWAGDVWIGNTNVTIYGYGAAGDTLFISANRTGLSQREETILVRVLFTGPGTYPLGPGAARLEELVGADVLTGEYTTTADATGTLVISKFDAAAQEIEGILSFDGISTVQPGRYGTRAMLEDGRFRSAFLSRAAP